MSLRTLSKDFSQCHVDVFKAHSGIIRSIKILPSDNIVTAGEDNKVKVWDISGNLISEFEHENFVQAVEILDQNTILSSSFDGTIKSWELDNN